MDMNSLVTSYSTLCFDDQQFFKESFDVEAFVSGERRRVALETLRDSLGVFLRHLRASMIELINRDFADFVSLSSALVSLEPVISKLAPPLRQLQQQVDGVRQVLDELLLQSTTAVAGVARVRQRRRFVSSLASVSPLLLRLETLNDTLSQHKQAPAHSSSLPVEIVQCEYLQRAASVCSGLVCAVAQCEGGSKLVSQLRPRIQHATSSLADSMRTVLLSALDDHNVPLLTRALQIYASLDQTKLAEGLFREHVVEPYMSSAVCLSALHDSPAGVGGVFAAVMLFVPAHCRLLHEALHNCGKRRCGLRHYDFLVNAVWPCVMEKIDQQLSIIFAPGNPNTFHERYKASMQFVDDFELAVLESGGDVERLRCLDSTSSFISRWNLPVYFQIRLQEIGSDLELSLYEAEQVLDQATQVASSGGEQSNLLRTRLVCVFETARRCVTRCWHSSVFLTSLLDKLWLLSVQITTRVGAWLSRVLVDQAHMQVVGVGGLVQVARAARHLVDECHSLLPRHVISCAPDLPADLSRDMQASMQVAVQCVAVVLPRLTAQYSDLVQQQTGAAMRSVSDIPRLFRRTNRDPPSTPSGYLSDVTEPLLQLRSCLLEAGEQSSHVLSVLTQLAASTCSAYRVHVQGVLTSVERMESSLRRLKRSSKSAAVAAGMSDDDKIRRQLLLDVQALGTSLTQLLTVSEAQDHSEHAPDAGQVSEYVELLRVVQNAVSSSGCQ